MRISSIFTGTTLGFMALFAFALVTAPASTVHAQAFPSFNCDAPGANLQNKINGASDGATIFFGGNCDDGPYFINTGQNLHLRGFSSGGTLSAPGGGDCVVCVRFAHVKFSRLTIDATNANAGISVEGATAEIFDNTTINANGADAGIRVEGGSTEISDNTTINAIGANAGISVFGGTTEINDTTINANGAQNGIAVFGGTTKINDTTINANGAFAVINIDGGEVRIGSGTDIDATGAQNGIAVFGGTVHIFDADIHDSGGVGINVGNSSHANIFESRIKDGSGDGIVVISSSSADIGASEITGNSGDGVSISFHSSVALGEPANIIQDNGAFGVRCGVSGALVVFAVPTWGGNGGDSIEEVGCELLDFTGSYP